jgi:hypothetical protein
MTKNTDTSDVLNQIKTLFGSLSKDEAESIKDYIQNNQNTLFINEKEAFNETIKGYDIESHEYLGIYEKKIINYSFLDDIIVKTYSESIRVPIGVQSKNEVLFMLNALGRFMAKQKEQVAASLLESTCLNSNAMYNEFSEEGIINSLESISKAFGTIKPKKIIIGVSNLFNAQTILGRSYSGLNSLCKANFPEGYVCCHYLKSKNWYIVTDANDGLTYLDRTSLETRKDIDYKTGDIIFKARERYAFGLNNPFGVYANIVSV